jgi:repressor LexA
MARTPPGETRERIFHYMRDRLLAGRPPTLREVMKEFGFSAVETVRSHLQALVEDGRLMKNPGKARGYGLPEGGQPLLVPVLGHVQAGELTTALEDPEGYVTVQVPSGPYGSSGGYGAARRSSYSPELFALRVRGESMIGANILPGDVVVVRKQQTADHGEIVVAHVGGEATVKRLKFAADDEGNMRPILHAENPDFAPIIPDPPDALELFGKVIEIRRYLEEPPPWVPSP